jgi:hypothetical protein
MRLEGQVGPQTLQDGARNEVRLGRLGATIVTELHGKYLEQSLRGNVYSACMTAGVIFPAPAATASNVITLANPADSGKSLSLIRFEMVITTLATTPAVGTYGLFVSTNVVASAVTGTALTPIPTLVGTNAQPVGKVFTTSTLPAAPTYYRPLATKVTTPTNPSVIPAIVLDFDGTAVLTPGTAITPQQTAADTGNATVLCSFIWEELPV